jgi:transcription initiation factor TFIID TATA-box-binding protein
MKPVSTMGSGNLGREIELEALVSELESLDLVTEAKFHGPSMVTVRLTIDGPAITVYRTGGFQIRGAEDRDAMFRIKDKLLKTLERIDLEFTDITFDQKNAVFLEDLDQTLNLESLTLQLGLEHIEYEPEQFPGLIYRPSQIDVVLIIFASGKVIVSGTSERKTAEKSLSLLLEQLSSSVK